MIEHKYTHLLLHKGPKFNEALVKMVHDKRNIFFQEEHLFVTPYKETQESLSQYGVVFDPRAIYQLMNYYAKTSEWVFIHDIRKPWHLLLVKKKNLKKMIWRTWGSDAIIAYRGENQVKRYIARMVSCFINKPIKQRIRQFRAIGIANTIDQIDIENRFGKVTVFPLGYPQREGSEAIKHLSTVQNTTRKENNILIEHSGFDDTHINILRMLEKYINEPIHLFLVLAYGYPEYIKRIKDYAEQVWGEKVTLITNLKPYEEYMAFLHDMDIAIFDKKQSYALGNIQAMVCFRKKFFINKDGVIRQAFDKERIPYCLTDSIPELSFQEFIEPVKYTERSGKGILPHTYEERVKEWHHILDYLEKEGRSDGRQANDNK